MKNTIKNRFYKIRNALIFTSFISFCFSFLSCNEDIEEISWTIKPHDPFLVVDGAITNELKNHGIRLTLSSDYFSTDDPSPIHNAVINVSDGVNTYSFSERLDNSGWYLSDEAFAGATGKTYELLITLPNEINNKSVYSSSSTMPVGLDIDSIHCEIFPLPEDMIEESDEENKDTTALVVYYYGNEPEMSGNYYFAKMKRNKEELLSSVKDYPFIDDSQRNGEYLNLMAVVKNVADKDVITFRLYSISEQYYNYIDAISNIDETGNIYSPQGPPANAIGNVEGALGFFIATYVSEAKSIANKIE